jgi:hypothetical protein
MDLKKQIEKIKILYSFEAPLEVFILKTNGI